MSDLIETSDAGIVWLTLNRAGRAFCAGGDVTGMAEGIARGYKARLAQLTRMHRIPWLLHSMISSTPATTEAEKARVARLQKMTPDKNAPLAVFLASDPAREVTGQIFVSRNNEIFLMSHNRPLRGIRAAEGWTPETIAEHALPALRPDMRPLERSADVFGWDPV